MAKKKKSKELDVTERYTAAKSQGASSKFGQLIGIAFARRVIRLIESYLSMNDLEYELLQPQEGKALIHIEMPGGTRRETDNVIVPRGSNDPVAIFESKWLKDGRHHNDKGAWILQMREMKKKNPTIRGAVANVLGYWTEGVNLMFANEGKVRMVLVADDADVYNTIQPYLNEYLDKNDLDPLVLEAKRIRKSMPRPWDVANCLSELEQMGTLDKIAASWFEIEKKDALNNVHRGRDLVIEAIDDILKPLPSAPTIEKFEIALQISTGNIIYKEFADYEEFMDFVKNYHDDPTYVLQDITPRPKAQNEDDAQPRLFE